METCIVSWESKQYSGVKLLCSPLASAVGSDGRYFA